MGIDRDFFLLCPKFLQFLGIYREKRDICPIPQEDPMKIQDFCTIFGHHGKNGGFLPKIFDDTRGGNMKLGEHMVGRPENGGSRRMGESGNGERKIREGRKMWRGRSAA